METNNLNYQELTKKHTWTPHNATQEAIQVSALLRIADAIEPMAKNYTSLLSEVEWYKRRNAGLEADLKHERRRSAAYLGRLRRLRKSKG